tara:strand:+ start:3241 stop:3393 length:153 start_codon:yes stop_codon:yes gene_type:complete
MPHFLKAGSAWSRPQEMGRPIAGRRDEQARAYQQILRVISMNNPEAIQIS